MCVSVLCPVSSSVTNSLLAPAPAPSANHICVALCHLKGMKTARTGLPREATSAHSGQGLGLYQARGSSQGTLPLRLAPPPPPGFWSLVSNMGLRSGPFPVCACAPKRVSLPRWTVHLGWSHSGLLASPSLSLQTSGSVTSCPRHGRTLEVLEGLGVHHSTPLPAPAEPPPPPSTSAASSSIWVNQAASLLGGHSHGLWLPKSQELGCSRP